jgi:hypothetical protein
MPQPDTLWNFHRIILKIWHISKSAKSTITQPGFTTQFTTTSPQKHHAKTPLFPEPPLKTPIKRQKSPFPAAYNFF